MAQSMIMPAPARRRIEALQAAAEDAAALVATRRRALDDLRRHDLVQARNRRDSTDPRDTAALAEAEVAEIEEKIRATEDDIAARAVRQRDAEQTLAQLRTWLERLPPNRVSSEKSMNLERLWLSSGQGAR
jgi:hypothetical protein